MKDTEPERGSESMVEMIALRGHVTTTGVMVLAGQPFQVAEDEANRYRVDRPHLARAATQAAMDAAAASAELSPQDAPKADAKPRRAAKRKK